MLQLKGASRCEMSTERWMKQDQPDMNCAAAANEISLQLEKSPGLVGVSHGKDADISSEEEDQISHIPPVPSAPPSPYT